ncbi:MAG: polyprenyl diphosphate synthase [Christensenellales bacterium]
MKSDLKKLPQHLALIIDGNGRWAKKRGLTRSMGHRAGFKRLEKITHECFYDYGIPIISVYCFSTENWNRPKEEVDYLREILTKYVSKDFIKKYPDVKLNVMGDYSKFGESIAKNIQQTKEDTKNNTKFILNLGINYSGQDELVYAVNNIINEGITKVDRQVIENHLYTQGQPPIDFMVRTSGEYRLSNFMLWQLAYAEFYFPKCHWPAFTSKQLEIALKEFQSRDRRFGAIKE